MYLNLIHSSVQDDPTFYPLEVEYDEEEEEDQEEDQEDEEDGQDFHINENVVSL